MPEAPADEQPIILSAEHLEPAAPKDSRIQLEKGMSYAAWLTLSIAAACVIVFLWQLAADTLASEEGIVSAGALLRDRLLAGEVWRLVTSMFLHGGFDHLLGNLLVLYVLGMACEHVIGFRRMALVYLCAGIAGGLLTVCFDDRPTIGASGAIFGLLGFLMAFLYHHRQRIVVRENRIAVVLAIWAAYQIALGFLDPFIANWAHVGGLVSGALIGNLIPYRIGNGTRT